MTIKITPNSPQKLFYVENLRARLQWNHRIFRQVISRFLVSQTVIACIIENFHFLDFRAREPGLVFGSINNFLKRGWNLWPGTIGREHFYLTLA